MPSPTPSQTHDPVASLGDIRARARRRLPRLIFDFIDGAAGSETSARANESDLSLVRLMPRVLGELRPNDLSATLLGLRFGLPFGIAPMGMCNLAWPRTDRMLASSAVRHDIPLAVSTASSTKLEALLSLTDGRAWFQLYVTGSTTDAIELADRAQVAGYQNLLLTVDVPKLAMRPRDQRNGFRTPFHMEARHFLDFAAHPRWSLSTLLAGQPQMANFATEGAPGSYDRTAPRTGANWDFLARLREHWRGNLIVKGVLDPGDAARIKAAGANGIYVSNHGGRQLGSAPSTVTALPSIRKAVGPGYPLLFDGGVRSGEDILKALALGASFIMIGRPFLFAAAASGAAGIEGLIRYLKADLEVALAQVGLDRIQAVTSDIVARRADPAMFGSEP